MQQRAGFDSEQAAWRGLLWRGQGRSDSGGALSSSVEPRGGSRVCSVTVGWTNARNATSKQRAGAPERAFVLSRQDKASGKDAGPLPCAVLSIQPS